MKRLILAIFMILSMAGYALADGTVVATFEQVDKQTRLIKYAITGDASDGSMSAISTDDYSYRSMNYTSLIRGWDLVSVWAYPTSGGTAPTTDSDFTVTENGLDLLATQGTDQISNTATLATYTKIDGAAAEVRILGALTVTVTNQAVHSATYTIELRFEKN